MLSYRHAFHAGNHADVLKHLILVQILKHLNQKEKPWWFVDTHAGAGIYSLQSDYAQKRSEYETGIARFWGRSDLPPIVAEFVEEVGKLNSDGKLRLYPGSPWIARNLMRPHDQLRLFELHSTDSHLLNQTFSELRKQVRIEAADGFNGIKIVLPPPSRRGLVLIDPPYELKDDYRKVISGLKDGLQRFATGTFAVWYPQLHRGETRELPEKMKRLPMKSWLHVSLSVKAPSEEGFGMHGSGMFIINPPWTLAEQLQKTMPWLVKNLGQDEHATFTLEHGEN